MLRVLVREGARVHAQRRVYTDCGTTCVLLCAWLEEGVQKARSRAGFLHSSGPIPRVTTPRIKLTYCICFSAKSLKHVWVFITRLDKMKESCSEPHI